MAAVCLITMAYCGRVPGPGAPDLGGMGAADRSQDDDAEPVPIPGAGGVGGVGARESAATQPASVALAVVDQRGNPVSDAIVVEEREPDRPVGRTGGDGVSLVTLPPSGRTAILVSRAGFMTRRTVIDGRQRSLQVQLMDACTLRVLMQDANKQAKEGIPCRILRSQDADGPAWESERRTSGRDGTLVFDDLLRGRYTVAVEDDALVATSFAGATRNGMVVVPDTSLVTVTLAPLAAACIQVAGDEVLTGYFRVHLAPAFAALGAGARAMKAQKALQERFPAAMARVWVADASQQSVEWIGYLRFNGWVSIEVTPRALSAAVEPEVRTFAPGATDMTSVMDVDWAGAKGVPLVAVLQDNTHGVISFEVHEEQIRVPLGVYAIRPLDLGLRRYIRIDGDPSFDLRRPGTSWTARAAFLEPLEQVACTPLYMVDASGSPIPLVGTIEVLDGDEVIGQHYCSGSQPIRLWIPQGRDLTWRCVLQGSADSRVVSTRAASTAFPGGVGSIILR